MAVGVGRGYERIPFHIEGSFPTMSFVPGNKVRYLPQPEWGVGHLLELQDEGAKALVLFPARTESRCWCPPRAAPWCTTR